MPHPTSTESPRTAPVADADTSLPFDGSALWIGQHAVDGDILVFDPAESDATATRLAFYSLTQYRLRTFPRSIVSEHIRPVTEEARVQEIVRDYEQRETLRTAHTEQQQRERSAVAADQLERQRAHILELHREYVRHWEVEYAGVQDSSEARTRRRLLSCRECGIALDDMLGLACNACNGVLCSCGACSCGRAKRSR